MTADLSDRLQPIIARAVNFDIDCAGPGEGPAALEAALDAVLAELQPLIRVGEAARVWAQLPIASPEVGKATTDLVLAIKALTEVSG